MTSQEEQEKLVCICSTKYRILWSIHIGIGILSIPLIIMNSFCLYKKEEPKICFNEISSIVLLIIGCILFIIFVIWCIFPSPSLVGINKDPALVYLK